MKRGHFDKMSTNSIKPTGISIIANLQNVQPNRLDTHRTTTHIDKRMFNGAAITSAYLTGVIARVVERLQFQLMRIRYRF